MAMQRLTWKEECVTRSCNNPRRSVWYFRSRLSSMKVTLRLSRGAKYSAMSTMVHRR